MRRAQIVFFFFFFFVITRSASTDRLRQHLQPFSARYTFGIVPDCLRCDSHPISQCGTSPQIKSYANSCRQLCGCRLNAFDVPTISVVRRGSYARPGSDQWHRSCRRTAEHQCHDQGVVTRRADRAPARGAKARLRMVRSDRSRAHRPAPIQATASVGNSTQATVSAPECRWHSLQEHVCGFPAGPCAQTDRPQRRTHQYVAHPLGHGFHLYPQLQFQFAQHSVQHATWRSAV